MTFPPLIIWAKTLFFFEQLFPVVARTWLVRIKEWDLCFGPKISVFGPKTRFLPNGPNFRYGVTAVSVKKSGGPVKKSSPFPLWGHRLPVTALALSERRPFGPAHFARGLDYWRHKKFKWRRKRIYHEIISSRLWQVSSAWRLRWKRLCSTWKRAAPEARLLFLFIVFAFVFIWSLVMNLSQGLIYIINYHAYVVSYNVMKPCQMDVMQQY